jgi:hypothetical protein
MGDTVVTNGVITDSSGLSLAADVTITGDLTVSGDTITVNTSTVSIEDSMLLLANNQGTSADAVDFGLYGKYGVEGTAKYAGIFRDQDVTGDPWTFFDNNSAEPGTTVNVGGTGYDLADISAGGITAADGFTGALTGDVTGNAATATKLATTRAIAVGGDVTGTANFDGSAAISITTTLANDAIVTANITNANVTVAKMAANSVDSDQYVDGSIDNDHIANGTIALAKTAITGGTNLTIATNALNVDDAFLTNTGDDTTDGTITAAGFTTGNDGVVNFADDLPSTDHAATGVTVTITSSAAIAAGVPVYISGAGTVAAADADAATTMPAIGINTTDLSGGAGEAEILLLGIWHDETYNFTAGADVFVGLNPASSTAASDVLGVTTTAPTGSGDTVQKVGVVLTADTVFVNFTGTEVLLA